MLFYSSGYIRYIWLYYQYSGLRTHCEHNFFDMFAGRIKSAILANFRDNYCQQMIRGKLRHLEFALFKALQRTY